MNETTILPVGVVLAGGRSSRMGTDKAFLDYHGFPQAEWTVSLLSRFCSDTVAVFKNAPPSFAFHFITDDSRFGDNGPLSGLLTAFQSFPDRALLVAGCDYPLLAPDDLMHLLENRSEKYHAAAFQNPTDGRPEPLLALYEPSCHALLHDRFHKGLFSLREFLESLPAKIVSASAPERIVSIDTLSQARPWLKKHG